MHASPLSHAALFAHGARQTQPLAAPVLENASALPSHT